MSDERDADTGGERGGDEIGAVGEEALKLLGALADIARQHSGDAAGTMGDMADHAATVAREINEHIATDSTECRYCPVCRMVHAVRQTSPEVRTHLMVAASSLMQAAAGLLETLPRPEGSSTGGAASGEGPARGPHVERIDLDGDDAPEDGGSDG